MVRTGASSYIKYDWEGTFGTAAFTSNDKAFGLNARLGSWTLGHSPKDLPMLNQVEIRDYAYGQQNGSLSVDFVLSNPWIFKALYGNSTFASATPNTHTWGTAGNVSGAKQTTPFSVEIGVAAEGGNIVRTATGCILNSLSLGTAIDDTVNASADVSYGNESDDTTSIDASPPEDDIRFPYTFAHGELRWRGDDARTALDATSVVAQLQTANITFAQNPALLYSIGSNRAVSSFRRVFDITGNFQASWINNYKLRQLLDQIETIPVRDIGTDSSANAAVTLTFKNGATGAAERNITIKLDGVRPDSVSIDGIVPVEPIFETINWRAKTAAVIASNTATANQFG